jgi:hypothetical protein
MVLLLLAALGACADESSVEWLDISIDSAIADTPAVIDGTRIRRNQPLAQEGVCASSLREARDGAGGVYAAWWSARADSSVALVAGYSSDEGRTWRNPTRVDTVDHTPTGCDRPPPAIAADRENVHIAYSLHGPEGTGVFFAHSMDRAGLFHAPVSIVYGDRLTEASIAAHGERVLVAYVDPNTRPAQIGLAISTTEGHNFQPRIYASEGAGEKGRPSVSISGDTIRVAWLQRASVDSVRAMRVTRTGRLR